MSDDGEGLENPWAHIVGPCYTRAGIARVLGWTEAEVAEAVASLALLEVTTDDGAALYPAFQLQGGAPVDGLGDVLHVLHSGTRGTWTWAQFLNVPRADAAGVSGPRNIERLRAGHLDEVLRDAQHDAAAWRS